MVEESVRAADHPWHIMKIYSAYGLNEFIVCLGYKGYMIKEYFANYFLHMSDVTIDFSNNSTTIHQNQAEPWRVTLVDTGADTQTGGRLKAIRHYLGDDEAFCFTYGDGVAAIDIAALIAFHQGHGREGHRYDRRWRRPGRFGASGAEGRPRGQLPRGSRQGTAGASTAAFFVAATSVLDLVDGPATLWEREPMERLARTGRPGRLSARRVLGRELDYHARQVGAGGKLWSARRRPLEVLVSGARLVPCAGPARGGVAQGGTRVVVTEGRRLRSAWPRWRCCTRCWGPAFARRVTCFGDPRTAADAARGAEVAQAAGEALRRAWRPRRAWCCTWGSSRKARG